jgi:hypothetical protein
MSAELTGLIGEAHEEWNPAAMAAKYVFKT